MITATALHDRGFHIPRDLGELRTFLQAAMEVEHLTIPLYMTGLYTIRPGTNRTAYFAIRSVLMEEMLHMTLAANLLNAVGGRPRVGRKEFVGRYPARLPFSDDDVPPVSLQHFSPGALRTFLRIEQPRSLTPPPQEGAGWTSIGQFYDALRQGLLRIVEREGEAVVFPRGREHLQVGPDDFYNSGGEVFAVHDTASALLALRVVAEQGEGVGDTIWDSNDLIFREERTLAHYFRFHEIYSGRSYGPHDRPKDPPSGPLVDVGWQDAHPIHGDSTIAAYERFAATSEVHARAVEFNSRYAALLTCLDRAFNGRPRVMALAVPLMLELRDRAGQLHHNPHPDPALARLGIFASPTFELGDPEFAAAAQAVDKDIALAGLRAGEPVDLSAVSPATGESFA
ncbi:ferritin-like protein [Streptomyces sp. NPDC049555]|uniref:ferritin-like domain-containing protein n=1 Tax=unclassified Streptomyces TaxID=2593676 RepID=UPI003426FB9D